jgi:prepilin-type N-terminal cleavage/methylation domain-containing protein
MKLFPLPTVQRLIMGVGLDKKMRWRAFTLIELLVVIAIIGILAALLLSALTGVKLRAQQIQSLSNVKQLSTASFMYASDNSRHAGYKDPAYPGGGNWAGTLMDYYAAQKKLLLCPSAPLHEPAPAKGNGQGYADRAWVRWTSDDKTMFYGSYGYNGWLYSDLQKEAALQPFIFVRESAIQKPSQTPVFADANWVDGWPLETDPPARDLYKGRSLYDDGDGMARWTIARHGGRTASSAPQNVPAGQKMPGAINMGMTDGHAELVKLEDLWNYYWHRDWQPPAVRPP